MNKFTYALALGAGLVLSLAAPNAQADPIVQSLATADMSSAQFNSLFDADTRRRRVDAELLFRQHRHGRHSGIASLHGNRSRRRACMPTRTSSL